MGLVNKKTETRTSSFLTYAYLMLSMNSEVFEFIVLNYLPKAIDKGQG